MRVRSTVRRLEEEKKKKRLRKWIKRGILFTVIGLFMMVIFFQSYRFVKPYAEKVITYVNEGYFGVREFGVVGASEYGEKEIRGFVEPILKVSPNIFSLPISQIKGFLYTKTYIKRAEIRRELPGRIVIEVEEKRPVAVYVRKGEKILLDENGEMIRPMSLGENIDLPVVTVEEGLTKEREREMIRRACYLIELDNKSSPLLMPSELTITGGAIVLKSLELKIEGEKKIVPIFFSPNDIEKKVLCVKRVWPEIVKKKEQLEYIDGRMKQGVLVKQKSTEVRTNG